MACHSAGAPAGSLGVPRHCPRPDLAVSSNAAPFSRGAAVSASADRNLLFGVLALQLDFVSRDQLVAAMNAWALEKTKPLSHILRDQGVLAPDTCALLESLVQ